MATGLGDDRDGSTSAPGEAGGWSPRSRVEAALRGERSDRVPFVIWNNKLPGGGVDEALLSADTCVIVKSSLYKVALAGVAVEWEEWTGEDGRGRRRTIYHTPAGDLDEVEAFYPGTVWLEKCPFTGPEDYDALLALIDSRQFVPTYERFQRDDVAYGDHGIARPATLATPMHEIIYKLLGVRRFAEEWADRRDSVLALYRALLKARRRSLTLVVESPARHVVIEANVSFEIVGHERFRRYYLPPIEEACELLHAKGKLAGAHLDANNRQLAPLVARTSVDFIESFTPPPDCDLSVAEARQIWPGKALYVNFPSSVHLAGPGAVGELARELLAQAAPGDGFILGVLENVPRTDTLLPLAECIRDAGRIPIACR
ncbi:MAG: hypothetical protein HYY04_15455 [Chloroflexi bacterium]|nr:hypothetical protein [Chloroflexota bacterium]